MPAPWPVQLALGFATSFLPGWDRRFATFEMSRFCNRRCSYCRVPDLHVPEEDLTLDEAKRVVNWLAARGYRILSCIGGEPLANVKLREGLTFTEYTLQVVAYATQRGMFVNVTSNGDFVTSDKLSALRSAGLRSIAFSLHSYTRPALEHLINLGRSAAARRIVPTISLTVTSQTAPWVPGIAARVTRQGILVSVNICQDHDSEFSTGCHDLVPSREQQEHVLGAVAALKPSGLVRTNRRYLREAPRHYRNNWRCDHQRDRFIHVGAGGRLDVCGERRTQLNVLNDPDLNGAQWRAIKQTLVEDCHNCMHQCYFEAENTDPLGDVPMFVVAVLTMLGFHEHVCRWARHSIPRLQRRASNVDWALRLM